MKVSISNPIPWSAVRQSDGSVILVISSGPRESVSIRFPDPQHAARFARTMAQAADMLRHSRVWQSLELLAITEQVAVSPGSVRAGELVDSADSLTESALQAAGFTYDPRSGWFRSHI